MFISVVIPTFHRNDLLARCLQKLAPSIQVLPADRYEVVVTDDGRDTSAEKMIAECFPWARWVSGPKRGPAANRNSGVRHARGDFIAFTDDDCIPVANWLAAFAAAIADDVDVYEGKTTCDAGVRTPMQEAPINLQGGHLWSCNLMIRRSAFEQLGGFDDSFPIAWCEDVDFHGRINRAGFGKTFVEQAIVDHPPRRRAGALAEGRRWESRALLWFKDGNNTPLWRWMPRHVIQVRLHQTFKYRWGIDTARSAGSAMIEWLYVLTHLRTWQRRYGPRNIARASN